MVPKAASGQMEKQMWKSWPDLYKIKWLVINGCKVIDGYAFMQ